MTINRNISGKTITKKGDAKRYLDNVVLTFNSDLCLIWPFNKDGNGYGSISLNGRRWPVHRYLCTVFNGDPPTLKHEAAHSCGRGHIGCVNKRHVSWKTRTDNQADRLLHGTDCRGERNPRAKLTETDVREIRSLNGIEASANIASRFGVSQSLVCNIWKGRVWRWMGDVSL